MTKPQAPYPGLRPFEIEDREIFYGRNMYSLEVLDRLSAARKFVAIVGSSGSGKSSLVRARVIPDLIAGKLDGSSKPWLFSKMRPGENPIKSLANALANPVLGISDRLDADAQPTPDEIELILQETQSGLQRAHQLLNSRAKADVNHFLLLDQFEEIFRYDFNDLSKREDAAHFVNLIINAVEAAPPNLFIALTMRTEYIAFCSVFPGLTNLINSGLYVVPPLKREELREAIFKPARAFGKEIKPSLAEKVVNDVGDAMDRLPIIQHAMMRTWDHAKDAGEIGVHHYRDIGGTDAALSLHADEIYDGLSQRMQSACREVFKALSVVKDGTVIRRPQRKETLIKMMGGDAFAEENFETIYSAFSGPGVDFLMQRADENETIDITHEAFLRIWKNLSKPIEGWIAEEAKDAEIWRRLQYLVDGEEEAPPLTGTTLNAMAGLWQLKGGNPEWLHQYIIDEHRTNTLISRADELVERSLLRSKRRQRLRQAAVIFGACLVSAGMIYSAITVNRTDEKLLAAVQEATEIKSSIDAKDLIEDALENGDYEAAINSFARLPKGQTDFVPWYEGALAYTAQTAKEFARGERTPMGIAHLEEARRIADQTGNCPIGEIEATPIEPVDLTDTDWPILCEAIGSLERFVEGQNQTALTLEIGESFFISGMDNQTVNCLVEPEARPIETLEPANTDWISDCDAVESSERFVESQNQTASALDIGESFFIPDGFITPTLSLGTADPIPLITAYSLTGSAFDVYCSDLKDYIPFASSSAAFDASIPTRQFIAHTGEGNCEKLALDRYAGGDLGIFIKIETAAFDDDVLEQILYPMAQYISRGFDESSSEKGEVADVASSIRAAIPENPNTAEFFDRLDALSNLFYAERHLYALNSEMGPIVNVVKARQRSLLQDALKLDPSIADAFRIGLADFNTLRADPAFSDTFDPPALAFALNSLAWRSFRIGEPEFAFQMVSHALDLNPSSVNALDTRGQILLELGRYEEGIQDLLVTNEMRGVTAFSAGGLGAAYFALGDDEKARNWHRQFLDGSAAFRASEYELKLFAQTCRQIRDLITEEEFLALERAVECPSLHLNKSE